MDDEKDIAIIEASAVLATLVFIVLSLYMSYYTQWYAMWHTSVPPTRSVFGLPIWQRWLPLWGLGTIHLCCGFFFVMAASAATIHLFRVGSAWRLAAVRNLEIAFFMSGLGKLAVMFFFRAPKDVNGFVILVLVAYFRDRGVIGICASLWAIAVSLEPL